jgi:hypothetical protein
MKLYFVIDGEPTEAEIDLVNSVKEFAELDKGLTVHPELIGGRPKRPN